jgi:hypothetical protein
MKTYGAAEIHLHLLEVNGQIHAPAALPAGKELPVPIELRLAGPHSRSRACGKEKNLALPGFEDRSYSP